MLPSRRVREANNQQETKIADCCLLLLALLFDPDDGASILFRNVGELRPDYTASHPRRLYSS
jgi:hypothetical protein